MLANLLVALAINALQIGTLLAAAVARRIHFHPHGAGALWFVGATMLLTGAMYGVAEILASRIPRQEEYIARVPAVAIAPWFLAGSLFPITAMPAGMAWVARFLPLTHALALMRYGLLGDSTPLHDVWRTGDTTLAAVLSLGVVGAFAAALTALAVRTFSRAAVR